MYSVCFWLRADMGGCKCRRKVRLEIVIIYNVSENQQLNGYLTEGLIQGQTAWYSVLPGVRRWYRVWPRGLSGISDYTGFDPVSYPVYTDLCTKVVLTQVNTLGLTEGIADPWISTSDTGSYTVSNQCLGKFIKSALRKSCGAKLFSWTNWYVESGTKLFLHLKWYTVLQKSGMPIRRDEFVLQKSGTDTVFTNLRTMLYHQSWGSPPPN